MVDSPVDVLGEDVATALRAPRVGRSTVVQPEPFVELIANRLLVFLGDAEQEADGAHRHLRAEIGDEVEAVAVDERIERSRRRTRGPWVRWRSSSWA